MSSEALEQRLTELETRIAFLDSTVQSLDATVASQDRMLVDLRREFEQLRQDLRGINLGSCRPILATSRHLHIIERFDFSTMSESLRDQLLKSGLQARERELEPEG